MVRRKHKKLSMQKGDLVTIFYEGHEFVLIPDGENLMIVKEI